MVQNTDLTFFTNEPERDLYSRFSKILKSNTQFFDVLVGYFRTSGFFKMYDAMETVEKIRILVGLNVDKYTVKIIDKANAEIKYEVPTMKEAKESFSENVENEFAQSDTTSQIEQGVRTFIEWLKNGKLEMRMYVDAPIHAKVYIMRKDMNKIPDTYGSVITGSSNFSEAGLQNNLEFNVELKDSRDVQFALEKFEELWAQGVPVTEEYIEAVEKKTWLPWNPTRIMQRVGRINRVGTEFDQIYVFNFFPTAQTSKHLPLKDRIIEKLQAFHDTLGEDFKYLSEAEEVSSQKLFNDLNMDLDADEESASPELAYLAVIRQIRDNDIALFEKIKKLPKKAKTGKLSDLIKGEATLSFIKKGYLKTFFITNKSDTKQISFMDAVNYLKCEPDVEKISVGKEYFTHFDKNNEAFDYSLIEEDVITNNRPVVAGNDQKMIRYLRALQSIKSFTDDQEEKIRRMIEIWENGDVPANDTKAILKEIKNVEDGVEAYYKIEGMLDDKYFEGRKQIENKADGEKKEVILSCYMKGAVD